MHKLAALCVKRPVFATMLILALMVVGVFSFFTLGVDLFPKIDLPTIIVTVSNPGASAEEIETEITKRIEDAVNTISGIDDDAVHLLEGNSHRGHQLHRSTRTATSPRRKCATKSTRWFRDLPETAKAPVVQKFDPDAQPILQMAVSSPRPLREVTEIADKQIKPQLENISGVGEITIVGGLKREIHVWVDPDKMRAYNLTVTDVVNALQRAEPGTAGGSVNAGAKEFIRAHTGPPGRSRAVQRNRRGPPRGLRRQGQRHRPRRRQRGRADHRRAPQRQSRRHAGGRQAIRRKHRRHRRRRQSTA